MCLLVIQKFIYELDLTNCFESQDKDASYFYTWYIAIIYIKFYSI